MKLVIIGNSTAAVGAVEGIRKHDRDSSVTIISEEIYHTYARPLISYFLAGKVDTAGMAYRPTDFYQENNVAVKLGQKAVAIDSNKKTVVLSGGETVNYDRLLVATGSKPTPLNIAGIIHNNVFPFYTLADSQKLQKFIQPGIKGVVLGAGLTALKAAEALVACGVETTLVVRSRILRNFLDTEAATRLANHLQDNGLRLVCGHEPVSISGKDRAEAVKLANGEVLPCDLVISSVGISPNTEVVQNTDVGVEQGILVDQAMQTNIKTIYAAGDVAQAFDLITKEQRVIPLLPVAYNQGFTAGQNMAGAAATYAGMTMNAVSFFGLPLVSAGRIEACQGDEVYTSGKDGNKTYRKLIFRGDQLVGYVLMEQIDRAGVLTWLIREKIDVSAFKQSLLDGTFNYAHLPAALRREKCAG